MMDLRRNARRPGPWVVALTGLALVVVLLLLLPSARRDGGTLPPPPPPFLPAPSAGFPAATPSAAVASPEPTSAPVASAPAARLPAPARSASGQAAPSRARPATSPPQVTVTGRYRVVDSFPDGFIGEVLIANTTAGARDWTVRLRFPDDVGALRTSWVESAPQAALTTAGDTYTWSSSVPVAARSTVTLRFHFARSGPDQRPRTCTVNGATCG
jgi:hypothetical protein